MVKVKALTHAVMMASLMAVGVAQAEAPMPGAHGAMTMGQMLDASGIMMSGYVEAGYTQFLGDSANFRVFDGDYVIDDNGDGFEDSRVDSHRSSFNLNQAAITIAKQPKEGAGAVINLTAGTDADIISSNGSTSGDNFDVTQAFLQYAAPGYTVMAGKFVTMSGAEVISTPANSNISRSILFGYAIPFTHTGARVQLPLSDSLNVFVGVNNGWDQLNEADTGGKTGEFCVTYAGGMLSAGAVLYTGEEPLVWGANKSGRRDLVDAVVTAKLSDALSLVLNADYGRQENTSASKDSSSEWLGVAGYANFQISEAVRTSVRAEWFDDKDGYKTGFSQELKELTATVGYAVDKSMDVAVEVRQDLSNVKVFLDSDGKPDDQQFSLALRGLYKF